MIDKVLLGVITNHVLGMMLHLHPTMSMSKERVEMAEAIARTSIEEPLFEGDDGVVKTASVFVSVDFFESGFNAKAVGDHGKSVCAFQINESVHQWLGVTREQLLSSIDLCTKSARKIMKISFEKCKGKSNAYLLSFYASGDPSCERGQRESSHRMLKAKWLFAKSQEKAHE